MRATDATPCGSPARTYQGRPALRQPQGRLRRGQAQPARDPHILRQRRTEVRTAPNRAATIPPPRPRPTQADLLEQRTNFGGADRHRRGRLRPAAGPRHDPPAGGRRACPDGGGSRRGGLLGLPGARRGAGHDPVHHAGVRQPADHGPWEPGVRHPRRRPAGVGLTAVAAAELLNPRPGLRLGRRAGQMPSSSSAPCGTSCRGRRIGPPDAAPGRPAHGRRGVRVRPPRRAQPGGARDQRRGPAVRGRPATPAVEGALARDGTEELGTVGPTAYAKQPCRPRQRPHHAPAGR